MKDLQFVEGLIPKGFKSDFESFLFNDEPHRLLQSPTGWHSYCLVHAEKRKAMAVIHFCLDSGLASSPCRAPFGSLEFSKRLLPIALYEFLKRVEGDLRSKGAKKLRIKSPPDAYSPAASSIAGVLLFNLGYRIGLAEISTLLAVDEIAFEKKIDASEIPRLKQAKKEGLTFQEVPIGSIGEIYEFNRACREERQQSLSMTLDDLMKPVTAYPENFKLFAMSNGREFAAASISIQISPRILYNFYLAHPRKFDSLSPVVALMEGIYGWCQNDRVGMIDLGTSSLEGQPNFSLLDFKLRLNGSPSMKLTFEKDLL